VGVLKNGVLRRIFGPKRDGLTGEWREVHNEELNDLYRSPNIVRVIKSKIVRWAGHVARMGRRETYTKFLWENLRERDLLVDPGVVRMIISRWIFRKWGVGLWNGSIWLSITGSGHL
jgi:hypothetical protein